MNTTQKASLFLFAFTNFGIAECADTLLSPSSLAKLLAQTRQTIENQQPNSGSPSSSRGSCARPGTPIGKPLASPRKTSSSSYLTPPPANSYLHSPASQQQARRAPQITGQECIVVFEDALTPTTPQPAGAFAVPASATTPTHSAPESAIIAAKVKAADAAQRHQTLSASALHSVSCKTSKKNALHKQYLQPRDFIEQNKDNPEALDDFLENRKHFYVLRSSKLGLPLPPSPLQLKDKKKESRLRTTSPA